MDVFVIFLDEFVERTTIRESTLKTKIVQCKDNLKELNDEMEILTVDKQMACEEYDVNHCKDVVTE